MSYPTPQFLLSRPHKPGGKDALPGRFERGRRALLWSLGGGGWLCGLD